MNSARVTTGVKPLTIGSTELFQLTPYLNGILWQLSSATLYLVDPTGTTITIAGSVSGYTNTAPWTVIGPEGTWVRAWKCVDAQGIVQYTLPFTMPVIASPGLPFLP